MANLDSLQIEIVADAQKADNAIVSLANKLDRLTTSMASLNRTNLSGFSMSMRNIATSMQGLKDVKLPDYTRLAKGINKFASIDTANIHNAGLAMQELGKSLRVLDGVNLSDDAIKVADFVKSVSKFGNKSATQAVDNIPKLATALRNLMGTLSGAPLVSQNLIDMTNALANLARTGASSGRASTSLARSLDLYSSSSNRARKSTWSLASAFGKMYASYWLVFRAFGQIKKAIDISSDLTEIQNVVDVTFGDMTSKVERFAETSIQEFGMSELTLKRTASQFQAMGSAMNINEKSIGRANEFLHRYTGEYVDLGDKMADVSVTLTKLTADMASFYNVEQKDVAEDLQSIFTGQTKPLRQYGIDLTEATLKEWAMTEGMNANIESMTQAEKVMLRYQYVLAHTTQAQGDFADTAHTWANQIRILKQNFEQLGAIIGGTFINMLKPLVRALNTAMSSIITFAQTISNALGKIFGWTYEVGNGGIADDLEIGAGYSEDISDGLSSAVDSAKKLNQQLQGFDRLNVLRSQQKSEDSSGSGSDLQNGIGAIGGEWIKGDSIFEEYKSEIDTLYELGDYISQTLSRAMESIDWEKIYEKARGFGTGLADFLNGLISPRLFGNIGKTIANSLNTALYFLNSFGETFDFYEFGESIAWGIRDFFDNFDFTLLADTLNTWVDGLKDAIRGFVDTITWDSIIKGATDFFGTLEMDTVAVLIGGFWLKNTASNLKKLFTEAVVAKFAFTTNPINIPSLALSFGKIAVTTNPAMLADLSLRIDKYLEGTIFDPYSWDNWIGESLRTIAKITNGFADVLITILKNTFNWDDSLALLEESKKKLKEAFSSPWVEGEGIFGNNIGKNILLGIIDGFVGAIGLIVEPIANFFEGFYNSICDAFGINSPAKNMMPLGEYIFLGIIEGFKKSFSQFTKTISYFWTKYVQPWFSKDKWTFDGIKDGLSNSFNSAINALKENWNGFKEWLNSKLSLDLNIQMPEWLKELQEKLDSKDDANNTKYAPNSVSSQSISVAKNYNSYARNLSSSYGSNNYNLENALEVAVSKTLVPYLADIANSNREVANKEFGITERSIGKAVQNQNRISVKRTGQPLIAT